MPAAPIKHFFLDNTDWGGVPPPVSDDHWYLYHMGRAIFWALLLGSAFA